MTLHVKVKPGSKLNQLFYDEQRLLNVKIKAPAQDGKANDYLVKYLAKQLGLPKSSVVIVSGFTNPHKRLEIEAAEEVVRERLAAVCS